MTPEHTTNERTAIPDFMTETEEGVFEIREGEKWGGTLSFCQELIEWVDDYSKNPKNTTLHVHLDSIDPSSAELLSIFFRRLVKIRKKGFKLDINWYYSPQVENNKAYGYVFSKVSKIRFRFISILSEKRIV